MCAISGIFAYDDTGAAVNRAELLRVCEAMHARGPDGAGSWVSTNGRIGLAHRRLAIIDLSPGGAQPMSTRDGRLHITFNGEIYNHRKLRTELEARHHCFQSNSDTEVLLHLYADRGVEMLHSLRGMFAFAIWDEYNQELFAARDPFGIKPLYYADDGHTLRFASQVKALLKGGSVDASPDAAGKVGFLVLGAVPEPHTLYKGIKALPAGSFLRLVRGRGPSLTKYFDVGDEFRKAESASAQHLADSKAVLKYALTDSVRHHLVADVPVGLFLSAGLDSTTVAGLAVSCDRPALNAVTLGFREFEGSNQDEVPLAAEVARKCGINHRPHWITRDDFESARDHILEVMDQPSIDGVNTYFVSRAAAQAGMKVALSGVGGDELLGGYPSYRQIPVVVRALRAMRSAPSIGRIVRRLLAPAAGAFTSPKYAGIVEYGTTYGGAYLLRRALFMPWELESIVDRAVLQDALESLGLVERMDTAIRGIRSGRSRVATLELNWYMTNQLLRDADWAGMAHSLEIRTPMVDVDLFRTLAPLVVSQDYPTKRDLASVLGSALPASIVSRPKTGFATPVQKWISSGRDERDDRGLRNWARCVLAS